MGVDDVPCDELQKAAADAARFRFIDLVKMSHPDTLEPLEWFLTAYEPLLSTD